MKKFSFALFIFVLSIGFYFGNKNNFTEDISLFQKEKIYFDFNGRLPASQSKILTKEEKRKYLNIGERSVPEREINVKVSELMEIKKNKPEGDFEPSSDELSELPREIFKGHTFKLLKDRVALDLSKENIEKYPAGFRHLNFWIVSSSEVQEDGLRVVYDQDKKTFGVISGIITVKLDDLRDVSDFVVKTGGREVHRYERLKTISFKLNNLDELLAAEKYCRLDSRFNLCDLEVLKFGRYAL